MGAIDMDKGSLRRPLLSHRRCAGWSASSQPDACEPSFRTAHSDASFRTLRLRRKTLAREHPVERGLQHGGLKRLVLQMEASLQGACRLVAAGDDHGRDL